MERAWLRRIQIRRFLSYGLQDVNFRDATFLVGRNGAGKSNFARAVLLLNEVTREPLRALLDEDGGIEAVRNRTPGGGMPHNVHIFAELAIAAYKPLAYGFELKATAGSGFTVNQEDAFCGDARFTRRGGDFNSSVPSLNPSVEDESLVLPLVAGSPAFSRLADAMGSIRFTSVIPERLREFQVPDSGLMLRSDGSNVSSVLREMIRHYPDRHQRLCEFLSAAVPGVLDVQPKKLGNRLTLEFTQARDARTKLKFDAMSMSDGTLRIVGLLIALLQSPSPMMLVIEEPEAAIHPGALAVLLDAMKEAKDRSQLLVTTQSPEILDADWITEDDVRIVDWQNGFSRISPLASGAREMLRNHLFTAGELLRSGALVGEPAQV